MIVLFLLIFIFLLFYLYLLTRRSSKYMRNVPGPKPNIFLGNLIELVFVPPHKYFELLMHFIDIYGPIIKFHDGPLSVAVLIKDVKFVEHILSSNKFIDKAGQYKFLHAWLGEGLLVSTGNKWKSRRKMLTPAFHFSILQNFIEVFDSVGNVFIQKLDLEIGKKSVDIRELVSLCTLDVICEAAMGIKLNAQTNKTSAYVKSTKTMCGVVVDRVLSVLDPSLYIFTYNYFVEKRALKIIHAHTDSIIDKRIAEKQIAINNKDTEDSKKHKKKKLAFLDLLLEYTMDGEPLSRMDIREEVDTFMFEGHDTTSSTIAFTLFSLATNPHVQQKAYLEQKRIYENKENCKLTTADLNKMKYLELVIKETLRLYPPVPFLGRKFPEDMEWDGYLFQKGTTILLSTFAMQRDAQHFPDPLKFIPERFESSNLTNPYIYTPFSAGPRNCIGQKFAMLEMKSLISKVLRNFELLPATPAHELQLIVEIILVSKNGIRLALKRRTN